MSVVVVAHARPLHGAGASTLCDDTFTRLHSPTEILVRSFDGEFLSRTHQRTMHPSSGTSRLTKTSHRANHRPGGRTRLARRQSGRAGRSTGSGHLRPSHAAASSGDRAAPNCWGRRPPPPGGPAACWHPASSTVLALSRTTRRTTRRPCCFRIGTSPDPSADTAAEVFGTCLQSRGTRIPCDRLPKGAERPPVTKPDGDGRISRHYPAEILRR